MINFDTDSICSIFRYFRYYINMPRYFRYTILKKYDILQIDLHLLSSPLVKSPHTKIIPGEFSAEKQFPLKGG